MVLAYLDLAKQQGEVAYQQELVTIASNVLLISAQPFAMGTLGGRGAGAGSQYANAVSALIAELRQPYEATDHPHLEAWSGAEEPEFSGLSGVMARHTRACAASVLQLARIGMPTGALDLVRASLSVSIKLAVHSAVASQSPQTLQQGALSMQSELEAYREMSRTAGGLNYELLGVAELFREHTVVGTQLVMRDPAASLRAGLARWERSEARLRDLRASGGLFALLGGVHELVTEAAAAFQVLPAAASRLGQEQPQEARVAEEYRVFGTEIIMGQGSPLLSDLIGYDHTGPPARYRRFPFLIGPQLYRAGQAARAAVPDATSWSDYPLEVEGYTAVAAAVDAAASAPFVEPPGSRGKDRD